MSNPNEPVSGRAVVFPTTGGISVEITDDSVRIEQDDYMGSEAADVVDIPRPLFKDVLNTIFARLDPWELDDIAELAQIHAKPDKKRAPQGGQG